MNRRSVGRSGTVAAWVSVSALVVAVANGAACGSSGDDGAGSTLSGSATGASSGAGAGSGAGGGLFDGGTGSDDGAIDPDAACATGSEQATLVPVNMLVMFDKSGSMSDNDKWPNATSAMIAFFQDPSTAGLRIALRFFPDNAPVSGCNNSDCSVDACASPLVPIAAVTADPAPADAQEQALVAAVSSKAPGGGGGTPIFAALGGAEQWAMAYQAAHPTEKVVVVLVTDGLPNGCNENIDDIAALAAAALPTGVLTYAVGLEGSSEAQMDQIAQAGGTTAGFFIGNGNAQADLLAALKAIQGSSVSCNFAMPQSSDPSKPIDPAKINVNYTPGGGMKTTLGQVADAAACGPNGGWYYDDPAAPTQIILCPATCGVVQADPNADIEILIGCATQVGGPA